MFRSSVAMAVTTTASAAALVREAALQRLAREVTGTDDVLIQLDSSAAERPAAAVGVVAMAVVVVVAMVTTLAVV